MIIDPDPPPSDTGAERLLLGAWLVNHESIARSRVEPSDFYLPQHQRIAEAILALHDGKLPVEIGAAYRMASKGLGSAEVEALHAILAEAVEKTGAGVHGESWAETVKTTAHRRRLGQACAEALQALKSPGCDPAEVSEALRAAVVHQPSGLAMRGHVGDYLGQAVAEISEVRAEDSTEHRLSWGIRELDRAGMWIRPGSFSVIAARPGSGKTTLCRMVAFRLARATSRPVIYLTLEQEPVELVIDETLSEASIADPAGKGITAEQRDPLDLAADWVGKANVWLPSDFPRRLGPLLTYLHQHIGAMNPAAVFIDYLTLIEAPGKTTYERATLISARLRSLAGITGCPLVVAAQLNRASVGDKREPELHDLRDSGQIEQDATSVILLHYPWAQASRETVRSGDAVEGELWLKVAKNRRGRSGFRVRMDFQGAMKRMLAREGA